jgi:hypothetical protein
MTPAHLARSDEETRARLPVPRLLEAETFAELRENVIMAQLEPGDISRGWCSHLYAA